MEKQCEDTKIKLEVKVWETGEEEGTKGMVQEAREGGK